MRPVSGASVATGGAAFCGGGVTGRPGLTAGFCASAEALRPSHNPMRATIARAGFDFVKSPGAKSPIMARNVLSLILAKQAETHAPLRRASASRLARGEVRAVRSGMSVSFPSRLLIGGEWCGAAKSIPVVNPFTGAEFARVPLGEPAEIDRAIEAAHAVFPQVRGWP